MAKYQKYAEYKDSGVEWVDTLPIHWSSVHLKWISIIYAGGTPSKTIESYWENGVIPWINSGAVNQTYILEPSTYITKAAYENSSAKWIPKNALVMALAGQGKTKGMVAQLGIDTTCNQSMAAILPNDLSYARYLFWWITANYQNIRNMSGGDLRDGLNLEHLGDIGCPLPSSEEVTTIANFLDHETAQIDTLIAKQEKLIELLKEKRQAVISHAVTKGLNLNVPMKDSGIEWLGEVPKHWTVTKVGFHTLKIGSGKTPKGGAEIYQDEGVLFIRSQNVYNEGLRIDSSESTYISEAIHDDMSTSKVYSGDILLNITGGSIGRSSIVPDEFPEANVNQHVCIIRVRKYLQKFLALVIQSDLIQAQIQSIQTGGNREGLNFEQISKFYFALPSTEEQKQLVKYIEDKVLEFSKLEVKAYNAIQLMQERRTALISAAVTGKIDVRNWQHPNQKNNNNTELSA